MRSIALCGAPFIAPGGPGLKALAKLAALLNMGNLVPSPTLFPSARTSSHTNKSREERRLWIASPRMALHQSFQITDVLFSPFDLYPDIAEVGLASHGPDEQNEGSAITTFYLATSALVSQGQRRTVGRAVQ